MQPDHHTAPAGRPSVVVQRRRRRRSPKAKRHGRKQTRPARFFHTRTRYDDIRRAMRPLHLGECDWLLYRRRSNPYKPRSARWRAYDHGFLDCKADWPKPPWEPIP